MLKKIIKAADSALAGLHYLAFSAILALGIYFCADLYHVFSSADHGSTLRYRKQLSDTEGLPALSDDAVAWLTIDDTNVDYPVMQGIDNNVYLNTDPQGNYSLSGSIFLDSRCRSDFSDRYSIIYGHHMEYGLMFGALDSFMDRTYFDSHRTGTLTVGGKTYAFDIYAAVKTDAGVTCVFNPEDFTATEQLEAYIAENAWCLSKYTGGSILALSTCADQSSTGRWVVFAEIAGKA